MPFRLWAIIYVQPYNPYHSTSYTYALVAYCTDVNGYVVPHCSVSLGNSYYYNTDGHAAAYHSARTSSAYGHLTSYGGYYSGYSGWPFTFVASRVGGWEYIVACATYCNYADMLVGFSDIYLYTGASSNVLIGGTPIRLATITAGRSISIAPLPP
jgi:hypothetical protein